MPRRLFLIAGAEFLAMILVIVYVGAVAVLFLFVVMMLDIDFEQLRGGFQRYCRSAPRSAWCCWSSSRWRSAAGSWRRTPARLRCRPTPAMSATPQALGQLLYTDYMFLFQVAGLMLLVAMIGAIVLTLRDRKTSRHQVIACRPSARSRDAGGGERLARRRRCASWDPAS